MYFEEVLLRRLYELVSGADQHEIIAIFGKDQTIQSRAFKFFINHNYDNFMHLVTDNLHFNAFGMRMDLYGSYSLRKNVLKLLTFSRINARLRDLQEGAPEPLTMYGDSIYPRLSHLKSSWRRGGEEVVQSCSSPSINAVAHQLFLYVLGIIFRLHE